MSSIPADAILDEEMKSGYQLKRRSSPTLSEFAKPEKKLAGVRRMCEDTSKERETSESKVVGATSEELVPLEMPKEYKERYYVDRVSGDRLLVGPPRGRKMYTFLDGNFLAVECKLYGRTVLWEMAYSATPLTDRPYEGSEIAAKLVIDLVEINCLLRLPPPPSDGPLRKYLNQYMDLLIKLLEEEKVNGAKEMLDREKIIDFLVSHSKDIDFFVGSNTRLRHLEGSVVCAYYKNGRSVAPTLLYIHHGLKIEELYGGRQVGADESSWIPDAWC